MANNVKVDVVTADGAVKAGGGHYYGVRVTGDGTNVGRVAVYDGTDAEGTLIDDVRAASTGTQGEQLTRGVRFYDGLYVDVTTPGSVVVWYE